MENESVVRLENVSFAYDLEPALAGVDLAVSPGEFVSGIGPNGGGKTTLLRLILGLLKPDRGKVWIFGQPPEKTRRLIGYVPQYTNFDLQFPVAVRDVVLMGRLDRVRVGAYRKTDREAACAALKEVDLLDLHNRAFSDLSGGERQRVLLARALASSPRLLLLDEPTSNVDRSTLQRLFALLQRLSRELTIIMATHDVGFVSKFVTKVICLNRTVQVHPTCRLDGRIISDLYGGDMALVRHEVNAAGGEEDD